MGKAERRAERRLITCLFIDIVGSTDLTVRMGPERMKRALEGAFAELRAIIEREGGTVEKYVGDEIFAIFGAPVAHSDDPMRALRAAEAAARWSGTTERPFAVRAGVETGEALVDVAATERERQQMSVGACVNIASRLQSAADPGHVLVGPTCHDVAAEMADFESLGTIELKGIGPLPAWRLVSVGTSRAAARTPFVGREAELEVLEFALRRARSRRAVLALVSGPPGQGKTRLVEEFLGRAGADVAVLTARSRPGGENGAETPLRQLLRADVGDPEPARITARVRELLGDPTEAERVASGLAHSAGVAPTDELGRLPPAERSDEITNAWRRYLAALARTRTVVLWMEDVHWAESSLVKLIDQLTLAPDVPLLVVATARPEFAEHAGLRPGGDRFFVELPGLPADAAKALAAGAGATDALVERAEGNPLFVIELARARASTGSLPLSLQGAIGARLDELAAVDRDLLEFASVVGERFAPTDVAVLAHRDTRDVATTLERLASLQYLSRTDGQYRFHHALVRDVAYGRLPIADRMRLHARHARESVPVEEVETRAHHLWEALRPPDGDWVWEGQSELSALRSDAFATTLEAGRRYTRRFAFDRALEAFQRARALARDAADVARAEHALGSAYRDLTDGERAWEHYHAAIAAFRAIATDVPAQLYGEMTELAVGRWGFFRTPPGKEEIDALLQEAEAAARREGDEVELANVLMRRARIEGDPGPFRRVLELVEGAADPRPFANTLADLAPMLSGFGEFDAARAAYERVDAMRRSGASVNEAWYLRSRAVSLHTFGELEQAASIADECIEASAALGPHLRTHALDGRCVIRLARGDWDGLSADGAEVERIVRENPGTTFCVVGVNALGQAAFSDALASRPEEIQAKLRTMERMVPAARLRAPYDVLPLALLGRSAAALEALGVTRTLRPHETLATGWTRLTLEAALFTLLERWDDLRETLRGLGRYGARNAYLAALSDAYAEELAAARGGPRPQHAALRSLGYVGRSDVIHFRPAISR